MDYILTALFFFFLIMGGLELTNTFIGFVAYMAFMFTILLIELIDMMKRK